MLKFLMLIGVPCSGKTTYAKNLMAADANNQWTYISRDDLVMEHGKEWPTYNEAWSKVDQRLIDRELNDAIEKAVAAKQNIILDMTNLTVKSRRAKLSKLTEDYTKIAAVFNSDEQTIFKRNKEREGKVIPAFVINRMMEQYEAPTKEEGFTMFASY